MLRGWQIEKNGQGRTNGENGRKEGNGRREAKKTFLLTQYLTIPMKLQLLNIYRNALSGFGRC